MRKTIRAILLLSMLLPLYAEAQTWYFVGFSDKADMAFTVESPSLYLSPRAIQRRISQSIAVDEADLPVNISYVNQVLGLGATLHNTTKWLNGVVVWSDSAGFYDEAAKLPFVSEVRKIKTLGVAAKSQENKFAPIFSADEPAPIDTSVYGGSAYQVGQLNGQYLHNGHFKGKGKHIAVLDGGFYKADEYSAFDSLWANGQILGNRDFVDPSSDIFDEHYHGMCVLSIMGGNIPGQLIGTAPEASFWLLRSEDGATEFPIEEYNWASAAEFADSAGADIINTSLGYSIFIDTTMNYTYSDMDGKTAVVTRAANIAASRGMLVVVSAGNEGNNPWKYITAPSDGEEVIAVGAVNAAGTPAGFTSSGPSAGGDIKPNVSAVGWNTVLMKSNGTVGTGSGTSYSSPVIAGMAACLWQANPEASVPRLKEAIEKSSHLYQTPDSLLGYGIPDFKIADQILKLSRVGKNNLQPEWSIFPNPFSEYLLLFGPADKSNANFLFEFYNADGRILKSLSVKPQPVISVTDLNGLPNGIIFLKVNSGDLVSSFKLLKTWQ